VPLRFAFRGLIAIVALAATAIPALASETLFVPGDSGAYNEAVAVSRARSLIEAGDLDEAVSDLRRYAESHPSATGAARFLGDLYYREGEFVESEAIYDRLLALDPGDKETRYRLGVLDLARGRFVDATAQFEATLPSLDAIGQLVALHRRTGDLAGFQTRIESQAAQAPGTLDLQIQAGALELAVYQPQKALDFFENALGLDRSSVVALNGAGSAYFGLHQYVTAVEYFRRCLETNASTYSCMVNLAAAELALKQLDVAQHWLDAAYRLAPERGEALIDFGFLADQRGQWQKAVEYYQRSLLIDPYMPEAYFDLGLDYVHHGDFALAQSTLMRGVRANPDDGRIHYLLGAVYADLGNTTLALAEFGVAAGSFDPELAQIARKESDELQLHHALPSP
jgi:tetratricopeptide (TPR) repeat protein